MKKLLPLLLALSLILSALAGCSGNNSSGTSEPAADTADNFITVQDLVGKTLEEVLADNSLKELYSFEVEEDHSSSYAEGVICAQIPAAGETFREKPTVTLTVSLGTLMVSLDSVIDKSEEDAVALLTEKGFNIIISKENSLKPEGTVYSMDPAPGTKYAEGTDVTLYISLGEAVEDPVAVPDIIGLDRQSATDSLTAAGLVVGTVTLSPSDVKAGCVCAYYPDSGLAQPGDAIDLIISTGSDE